MSKYKISDLQGFTNSVFGADCFLEYWPEIKTTGVELSKINEFHYVMIDGRVASDTAFFNDEEMQFLEQV